MASINQPRSMAITVFAILLLGGGILGTMWWRQNVPLPSATFEDPALLDVHFEIECQFIG